jgi:hypothetical protein
MFSLREMRKAFLGTAAAALLAVASSAQASMIIDLRPVGGGSRVIPVVASQVVNLEVYAIVSGANATDDEAFTNAFVKLSSGNGGLLGNFSPATIAPAFQGTGFTPGVPTDQDLDTDLDLGGTTNASYMFARSPTANIQGTRTGGDNEEFLLGTVQFTVSALAASGQTDLFPVKPATGISPPAAFTNDNVASTPAGYLASGHLGVTLVIPEPGSIGLAALSAMGLLFRRR